MRRSVLRPIELATAGVLLTVLGMGPGTSRASSQTDPSTSHVQSTAAAMAGVQSFRFSLTTETQSPMMPSGPSDEAMAQCLAERGNRPGCLPGPSESVAPDLGTQRFTVSGEFQAPDRAHIHVEAQPFSQRFEGIVIGNTWTRTTDGAWRTGTNGPGPVSASLLSGALREFARFSADSLLSEDPSSYRITGSAPIPPGALEGSSLAVLVGGPVYLSSTAGSAEMRASQISLTVDKASGFLTSLRAETSWGVNIPMPEYPRAELGEGNGPVGPTRFTASTEQRVTATLTVSNFNDPAIQIQAPM
jgi:hypothetical protein